MLPLFYLISHYSNLPFRAWEQRKLNDIVKLENGYAFKSTYFSDVPSKTIVLTPGNVRIGGGFKNGKGRYYNEISEFPHKFIFQPEDIFVTLTDLTPSAQMLGYPAVVPNDGIKYLHNQRLGKLTDFKGDKFFLFQLLSTNKYHKYIAATAIGTTVKHSSIQKILQYDTSFPSFEEQKNIGIFFKQLDHTIALHQRKLDTLKLIKKGFLQQMFPNSEEKVPRLRFADFDREWEQCKLGEISDKVIEKNKESIYFETLTNSAEYGIISQREFFNKDISNEKNLNGYYIVRENDFVYNPRISNYAPVGPIKRNKLGRIGIVSPLYYVFRTFNTNQSFLEYYFDGTVWHNFMLLNGDSGARADRFAIKDLVLKEMPIPYSTLHEQEKISSFLDEITIIINLHQNKLKKLSSLKKAYLQNMFI
ncbi:restriction endonuclease subunit S [Listeria swaminathanii]|uniref:restriction endonuclease subunit S n=1 Tax=Listeria swaminathanii TaxID=2713501 RepID=UPI0028805E16|nr:restriction endonuclease subunit S [Listeria swaminathanii]MDT0032240.1 restriction endonuclease subunit S [Listeria swaminathanii]MDT0068482.1 restriction endonuclease subunit S [Listeria swaminathanii]